jgi:uncharacterized protein (DUF58 family)
MIDLQFLHQLDRLSLIIRKRLTSNYSGERRSSAFGTGLIFKEYLPYVPGEDIRRIDWKVFARSDRLYVKRFEEERNLTIHIVVDYSGSMGFGDPISKADYAAMLGIGFAYMALKNNERFVVSTFAGQLDILPPRRGRSQLVALVDHLQRKKPKGVTQFEKAVSKYKRALRSKSMVVVISDFLYPLDEVKSVLKRLRNHEVAFIQVLDPLEARLNVEGDFKLTDLESGQQLYTAINPLMRKRYIDQLGQHTGQLQRACDEVGAKFFQFTTNTPIFDAFAKVLQG